MGGLSSKTEKRPLPPSERIFGLQNYGNTCYCNSVLQALYYCVPFRRAVIAYFDEVENDENGENESLLFWLGDLFVRISRSKKTSGVMYPKQFVNSLRKASDQFDNYMHQDAHEFLNFLLNDVMTTLQKHKAPKDATDSEIAKIRTLVHELFEGTLSNQTTCMACETITSRQEPFLDLSVDVIDHSSITHCLSRFSSTEMLSGDDKFFCDQCCGLQEAEKRMVVKQLPPILTIHMKRFKFFEDIQRHRKLTSRVVFPFELRVTNTSDDCEDRVYNLFAVIIHIGSGPNHGHYVSVVKCQDCWVLFDDDIVDVMDEATLQAHCFGNNSTRTGYILMYSSYPSDESDQSPTPINH